MQHQTNVTAINTHTEGDGGHKHWPISLKKMTQRLLAQIRIQTGVIGNRLHTVAIQSFRPAFNRTTRPGIDQRRTARTFKCSQHLRQRVLGAATHHVVKIVPLRRAHLNQRVSEFKQPKDVGSHPWSSGGTQRHHRNSGAQGPYLSELPVVGAEIMAPCADAVGFVNRQSDQSLLRMGPTNQVADLRGVEPFRCQVKQPEHAIIKITPDLGAVIRSHMGVKTRSRNTTPLELPDLIFHQGDKW